MDKQNEKLKVLVLGGQGFIGSQVVEKLANKAEVSIGTRKPIEQAGFVYLRMQFMLSDHDWTSLLQDFDVVVNCIGILREKESERYDQVHHLAVKALAKACAEQDVNLIHVSALGLSDQANSAFSRSKFAGEQGVLDSGAKATIVRPSLLYGEGGYATEWLKRVANWPIQPIMQTEGKVAPLHVSDLGEAIANLALVSAERWPAFVELGGDDIYQMPNYLTALRKRNNSTPAIQIVVPKPIVRLASHLFDMFDRTPLSYASYLLMQGYNVPGQNLLPQLLGRRPSLVADRGGMADLVPTAA